MLFCEKCNCLASESVCPQCGNKKLRAVEGEDFCHFINISAFEFEMYEFALKDNGIDVVGMPYYPVGVSRSIAGNAGGKKVYVRYKDFDEAKEVFESMFGEVE